MRVGIVALQHESNTFLDGQTTLADFERGALLTGEAIRREYADAHHEVSGFFQGLEEAECQAVPLVLAWATPGPVVEAHTLDRLLAMLLAELKSAGDLDGLLVAPHGAAVSAGASDMDGAWLVELRARVGPQIPIVGTLDLHANLTPSMVRATDALIGYRSNPHLDQRERGLEAARLMARKLRGEARPTQAAAFPPLAINIERQHTGSSPCRECFEALDDMRGDQGVLSNSLLLGFPYADVQEMGTSVLVVTNDDPDLAHRLADDFAGYLRHRQQDFAGRLISISEAVELAARSPSPVCLLDMGDNVGGGAPGDGTLLLSALMDAGLRRVFACLYDRPSVERATRAGIGTKLSLELGGKCDPRHGPPIAGTVRVRRLLDGQFADPRTRHGGRVRYDMGPTAVVELEEGPTVMLTSQRIAPFSLAQLTSCHVAPADFQALVVKGVHAPVAAYEEVCPTVIRVNTPGVTTADMTCLDYRQRRRPLYPFERA